MIEDNQNYDVLVCSLWHDAPKSIEKFRIFLYAEPSCFCKDLERKMGMADISIGHIYDTNEKHFNLPYVYYHILSSYDVCYSRGIDISGYSNKRYTLQHINGNEFERKFCSFVTSYQGGSERNRRNDFFKLLSEYKHIDAGGKVFKNCNIPNEDRIAFFADHKFTLCFENTCEPNYVTEKLYCALISKTIPIYWGHEDAFKMFNKDAFVFVDDFEEGYERVKQLDSDRDKYLEMLSQPMFNPEFNPFAKEYEFRKWLKDKLDKVFR